MKHMNIRIKTIQNFMYIHTGNMVKDLKENMGNTNTQVNIYDFQKKIDIYYLIYS